jgi:hypothetical protein
MSGFVAEPANRHQSSTYENASLFNSMGFDNSFDLEEFKNNFTIKIQKIKDDEAVFDVIGIDAPIANALRRILIAEVSFIINMISIFRFQPWL